MTLVLYFADAFGWHYLEETSFMEDFWDQRRPLETILGYSSTIIPCLVSGHPPSETGVWTEYFRRERPQSRLAKWVSGRRLLLLPVNLVRLVIFRILRVRGHPAAHKLRIPLQFAHIFDRNDMDYRRFPPVRLPVPTLDEEAAKHGLTWAFRWLGHGYDPDAELAWLEEHRAEVDVVLFYDASLDLKGHHQGGHARIMKPEMDRIDSFLRRAWEAVEPHGAEMLLFSDHGMADVERTYDLLAALAPLELGTDYLVFIDSTLARFWYLRDGARERVHECVAGAPGAFLDAAEEKAYGVDFPDDKYGQEILVADEGVVFHPSYISPSFFRTKNYPEKGTHGYRPTERTASGICFYKGTAIRDELPDPVPATEVFQFASHIMRTGAAR